MTAGAEALFFKCVSQVFCGRDDCIRWCDSWIGKIFLFVKNSSQNSGCA